MDLPHLTPLLVDGNTRHPVVLLQNDSFEPFPGILVCGDGDILAVAEEIARRCNNFKENQS